MKTDWKCVVAFALILVSIGVCTAIAVRSGYLIWQKHVAPKEVRK